MTFKMVAPYPSVSSTVFLLYFLAYLSPLLAISTNYEVGVGIADITGPAAEVNMVRYCDKIGCQ